MCPLLQPVTSDVGAFHSGYMHQSKPRRRIRTKTVSLADPRSIRDHATALLQSTPSCNAALCACRKSTPRKGSNPWPSAGGADCKATSPESAHAHFTVCEPSRWSASPHTHPPHSPPPPTLPSPSLPSPPLFSLPYLNCRELNTLGAEPRAFRMRCGCGHARKPRHDLPMV